MERKLASVQRILALDPIPGADRILKATINGWELVTAKDNGFNVGDLVVYFEIDSFIPTAIAPFLTKPGHFPKTFEGIEGERLRTIKLRGQVSQGLIMPIPQSVIDGVGTQIHEGLDLTEHLGILKWEKPISADMRGKVQGDFPWFIHKTDQERCQNIPHKIFSEENIDNEYEVTIKLEGSSITVFRFLEPVEGAEERIGVCSRNLELKLDEENSGNTYIKVAIMSGLLDALKAYGKNIAIQGELMGPGIEGNIENFTDHKMYIFDIFDIDQKRYMTYQERQDTIDDLFVNHLDHMFIDTAPRIGPIGTLAELGITDLASMLKFAEGKSINAAQREGIVFKCVDKDFSFKAISNAYLLGEKDD